MAVEWIHRHNNFIQMNMSKHLASSERMFQTTTSKVMSFNEENTTVHKAFKNASQMSIWHDSGTWITILLYSIIFLLAVIGNLLVILTLIESRRMRTITNVFLLNLAISDLLLGIFCMPFTLIGMLLRDFIFGEIMCKLLPYLQGVCLPQKKLYFMILMCIDFYIVWMSMAQCKVDVSFFFVSHCHKPALDGWKKLVPKKCHQTCYADDMWYLVKCRAE